jgi:O-acetyl-ADP-ribose deacetylase (regulator of RNase III)
VEVGGAGTLWVIDGDITEFAVGAVISDDDVEGRMWSQVASAIKRAAAEDVEQRSMRDRPYRLGDAWETHSGGLEDVETIIHVALMDRLGNTDIDYVERCVRNALAIAAERRLTSVALATIGTSPHGVQPDQWFDRVARVAVEHLYRPDGKAAEVAILVVLYQPRSFRDDFDRFDSAARLTAAAYEEASSPARQDSILKHAARTESEEIERKRVNALTGGCAEVPARDDGSTLTFSLAGPEGKTTATLVRCNDSWHAVPVDNENRPWFAGSSGGQQAVPSIPDPPSTHTGDGERAQEIGQGVVSSEDTRSESIEPLPRDGASRRTDP